MDYIRDWFSYAFRGLQIRDWMIHVPGRWADTCPPQVAPSCGGLDQWVGSTKIAELIEILFRGLTHVGLRNNVLIGWAHWRHLVKMVEPSAVPILKGNIVYRSDSTEHATPPIPLSATDALECHIKFSQIKISLWDVAICIYSLSLVNIFCGHSLSRFLLMLSVALVLCVLTFCSEYWCSDSVTVCLDIHCASLKIS